jgi:trimeric autotransporter adhesin
VGKTISSFYGCHNVYHNGFEITSMQGKYILFTFCVIFLLVAPATASLAKIAAGAPVFLGENDVDLSSVLGGCHSIAWWQNGTPSGASPAKNVTISEINTISERPSHFNISPELFTGFNGIWYCEDTKPHFPVFDLREPQVSIRVWDLDHDQDVTGKTVPRATNITYRIDTNLYPALNYLNRPNGNPSDGFFTVKLTDPLGRNIPNIYTGSYGGASTLILPFDTNPFVKTSPYLWENGNTWDRTARNIQGDMIYPPGTYTFTLTQNLNHMQESYPSGGNVSEGKTTSTATVTFLASGPLVEPSAVVTGEPTVSGVTGSPSTTPISPVATALPTSIPVTKKTTYAPQPAWIALLGVGIAGFLAIVRR